MESHGQFLHSQTLIDVLIHMKPNEYDKNSMIEFCMNRCKDNESAMKFIKQFDAEYQSTNAIWWYTSNAFLSDILNNAVDAQNVDVLFLFQKIIQDVFKQLRAHQCEEHIRVYRRQILSTKEFKQLQNSIGSFVSINSFLLTTMNRLTAYRFDELTICSLAFDDLIPVIFEIDADPSVLQHILHNSRPFSKIAEFTDGCEEFEVLFMLGSIFRLQEIVINDKQSVENSNISIIRMTWCSEYDADFKQCFDHIKDEYEQEEVNLLSLGDLAYRLGNLDQAERHYRRFLNELTSDDICLSAIYHNLGMVTNAKNEYDKGLEWYQKSVKILISIHPIDYARLSITYNSIGNVYRNKGDFNRALEYYNRAVKLFRQTNDKTHPYKASFYNNIGIIYYEEKKFLEALKFFKKSLAIKKKQFTAYHPLLSGLYDNIAIVYKYLGKYEHALESYNRSLIIRLKSLPIHHADIAMTYTNMGVVHEEKGDFLQALILFRQALAIYDASWTNYHTNIAQLKEFIARLQHKIKNSDEVLKSEDKNCKSACF